MMIDDEVDFLRRAGKMRRLQINEGDAVESLQSEAVNFSISISSSFTIAMFSGRVTRPNEPIGAVCLLRPSTCRNARPLAMASGSGSS